MRELDTGYVMLGDHQRFYGYTLFLCKRHVTEIFHLSQAEKLCHLEEMAWVTEAVSRAFGRRK